MFDADTGDFVFKFGQHGNASGSLKNPESVAYSPDGERIAVADRHNNRIQVFDADTGAFLFKFWYGPTVSVAYSPDGEWIAASPSASFIFVFDADTGDLVFRLGPLVESIGSHTILNGIGYSPLP